MIRTLLATTALAAFLISPAQSAEPAGQTPRSPAATRQTPRPAETVSQSQDVPQQVLASSLIGQSVFTDVDVEGEPIGNVKDVVIDADGNVEVLVIDVAGKNIGMNFDRVSWSERNGEQVVAVAATRQSLATEPEFHSAAVMDGEVATPSDSKTQTAVAGSEAAQSDIPEQPTLGTTPQMTDPEINPPVDSGTTASTSSGMHAVDPGLISADKLIGADMKVDDDRKVGEIGDVILGGDGRVEAYLVDVGDYLGVGEKPIAVGADGVQVMSNISGTMAIYAPVTKSQLSAQPAYDAQSYKADPERVLLDIDTAN